MTLWLSSEAWTVASPEPSSWTTASASAPLIATPMPPPSAVAFAVVRAVPKAETARPPPLVIPPSSRAREVPLKVALLVEPPTAAKPLIVRPSLSASSTENDDASSECWLPPASVTPDATCASTTVLSVASASEPLIAAKPPADASVAFAVTVVPMPVAFEPSAFAL